MLIIGYKAHNAGVIREFLHGLQERQRKLDAHADRVINESRKREVENRDRRNAACKEGREKECVDRIINSGLH